MELINTVFTVAIFVAIIIFGVKITTLIKNLHLIVGGYIAHKALIDFKDILSNAKPKETKVVDKEETSLMCNYLSKDYIFNKNNPIEKFLFHLIENREILNSLSINIRDRFSIIFAVTVLSYYHNKHIDLDKAESLIIAASESPSIRKEATDMVNIINQIGAKFYVVNDYNIRNHNGYTQFSTTHLIQELLKIIK